MVKPEKVTPTVKYKVTYTHLKIMSKKKCSVIIIFTYQNVLLRNCTSNDEFISCHNNTASGQSLLNHANNIHLAH